MSLLPPLALLAGACGPGAPRGGGGIEVAVPRIWVDRDTPRTVDLAPFVSGGEGSAEVTSVPELAASADGLAVTFIPAPGFTGDREIAVSVRRGRSRGAGTIPVRVKDGTRRCGAVFTFDGGAASVSVAGEWNGFSTTADPLVEVAPDRWELALPLAPGDYGYKLVADGEWILDPVTPLTTWIGGIENSRVRVADCAVPRLDLFDFGATATGFSGSVTFVAGADGVPIAAPPVVTLDGVPWSGAWDDTTRVLLLEADALAPGKHLLAVGAADAAGRSAERLRVPFWVEAAPFDWRDAVAYFVLTDRFRNGDPGNDAPAGGVATPANWQGGDWAGLREVIEEGYFDALGVNVLWLSPHADNPDGGWAGADGRDHAGYHGYWPKGPRAAEEHFGTIADLKAAVDAAHARGIRVLLDLVVNHVHEESPYWLSNPGPPWFHDPYLCGWEQPIACWFAEYLPDLDFRTRGVLDAQVADASWWVETTGADGFRVDAVKHFEHVVGRTLRHDVAAREEIGGSRFYMVGETFTGRWVDGGQAQLVEYVSSRELDGQFDFPLYWEILRTLGRREGTLHDLASMLQGSQGYYPPGAVMGTFVGNHDVPRFVSHAAGDIGDLYGNGAKEQGWTSPPAQPAGPEPYERLRSAFTLLFALPGMPTIYYGDEIGLAGAGDPDNRRAMPWTGTSAAQASVRAHVAALAAARRAHPELARGTLQAVRVEDDVLVIERRWQHQGTAFRAYAGVNRGDRARVVEAAVTAAEGTTFVDAAGGPGASVTGGKLSILLPPRGSALLVAAP